LGMDRCMKPLKVEPNKKFGKLTYLEEGKITISKDYKKIKYGVFECECGNTKEIMIHNVVAGHQISCGCMRKGEYNPNRYGSRH
jgi:hypothetical protein